MNSLEVINKKFFENDLLLKEVTGIWILVY